MDRDVAAAGEYTEDAPTLVAEVQAQHVAESNARLEALRARFRALCPEDFNPDGTRKQQPVPEDPMAMDPVAAERKLNNYINFGEEEIQRLQALNNAHVEDDDFDIPMLDDGNDDNDGEDPEIRLPEAEEVPVEPIEEDDVDFPMPDGSDDNDGEDPEIRLPEGEEVPVAPIAPAAEQQEPLEEVAVVLEEEEKFKPRRSPRIAALNAQKTTKEAKAKKKAKKAKQPTRFSRRIRGLPPI